MRKGIDDGMLRRLRWLSSYLQINKVHTDDGFKECFRHVYVEMPRVNLLIFMFYFLMFDILEHALSCACDCH